MNELAIGEGVEVTLHFEIILDDGTVVDSNFAKDPATFTVGDGNLLPGFEEVIMGLKAHDKQQFVIPPEKGFGQHNPNNLQQIERKQFPADVELEVGLVLSFADAAQAELPGVIKAFDEQMVTIDFNHPLAGRELKFSVHILEVKPSVTH